LATTIAWVLTEQWWRHYNAEPSHCARGHQSQAPPAILPSRSGPAQADLWHVQPAVPNDGPALS
jgi:hypothetical protein